MSGQPKYYSILTDIGRALLANSAVKGEKVDLTQFAVGNGGGAFYSPTGDMRALKSETWRGVIAKYEVDETSANIINVSAILSSEVGGFTIREMGIYTAKGELFAICNCPDTAKVIIDEGVSSEMELTMSLIISNTEQINFEVDPTVILATKKDIESHNNSPMAHKELFDKHFNNKDIHVTPTDKTSWNGKAAGDHNHEGTYAPNTHKHDYADLTIPKVLTTADGLMTKEDKAKLDGVAASANNYSHPVNHPASIITQDANNRFVTDAEKAKLAGLNNYNDTALKNSVSANTAAIASIPSTPLTMTAKLTAGGAQDLAVKQVRNVTISSGDAVGGVNGDMWFKYS